MVEHVQTMTFAPSRASSSTHCHACHLGRRAGGQRLCEQLRSNFVPGGGRRAAAWRSRQKGNHRSDRDVHLEHGAAASLRVETASRNPPSAYVPQNNLQQLSRLMLDQHVTGIGDDFEVGTSAGSDNAVMNGAGVGHWYECVLGTVDE